MSTAAEHQVKSDIAAKHSISVQKAFNYSLNEEQFKEAQN